MKNVELEKVYRRVREHLLKQNEKSVAFFSCMYRGERNTSCAVGCLIPDHVYTEEIESNDVQDIRYNFPEIAEAIGFTGQEEWDQALENLLSRLQNVHDTRDPVEWSSELDKVARDYGFVTEAAHV